MSQVHETAIVAPSANLDSTVVVGPYSIIESDVCIDAETVIGPHCVIKGHTEIGKRNQIFQFSSIGDIPQDKKYAGEPTRLVIGDDNTIREFCTINCGTVQDRGVTEIGNNNWLMAYVHIAHDCIVGSETIFANTATLGGHVEVGDFVIFGGFSSAHQFCRIGKHAFIASNASAIQDVPPYVMAHGRPAQPRGINSEGLKRRGFTPAQTRVIKQAYRLLFRKGLSRDEALEKIAALEDSDGVLTGFLEFVRESERGIAR